MFFLLFCTTSYSKKNNTYDLAIVLFTHNISALFLFLPISTFFSRPSRPDSALASLAAISKSVEDELLTFSLGIFGDTDDTFVHLFFLQFSSRKRKCFFRYRLLELQWETSKRQKRTLICTSSTRVSSSSSSLAIALVQSAHAIHSHIKSMTRL